MVKKKIPNLRILYFSRWPKCLQSITQAYHRGNLFRHITAQWVSDVNSKTKKRISRSATRNALHNKKKKLKKHPWQISDKFVLTPKRNLLQEFFSTPHKNLTSKVSGRFSVNDQDDNDDDTRVASILRLENLNSFLPRRQQSALIAQRLVGGSFP